MQITGIDAYVVETSPDRTWLFLEVLTDEGIVGLGEASQSRNDAGVVHEIERLKAEYVGRNPLDLIESRLAALAWPYVGRTLFAAVSGLEQALWDILGKKLGVPVYQLLGGRVRDKVRAYANIGYALRNDSPAEAARVASEAVAAGFDAIKLYAFGERARGGPHAASDRQWISAGVERMRAVREAVGPNVDILLDLMHQLRDLAEAKQVSRLLDEFELFWIEDPFPSDDPTTLAEYRRGLTPRLAGGAPHLNRRDFRPLLESAALDVIMPDVKWLGGMLEAKKTAAMAEVYGVVCSPHNASGPVSCAASVHLCATLANFLILEYAWGAPEWRSNLCRNTEQIENGYFVLPKSPGLGIELDREVAARIPSRTIVHAGIDAAEPTKRRKAP